MSENKDQINYILDSVITLDELEELHINTALNRFGKDKESAAKALGISLKTLYNKLNSYAKRNNNQTNL